MRPKDMMRLFCMMRVVSFKFFLAGINLLLITMLLEGCGGANHRSNAHLDKPPNDPPQYTYQASQPNYPSESQLPQEPPSSKKEMKRKIEARGIYVSGWAAAAKLDQYIAQIKQTSLNAIVIDLKNENGLLTYRSNLPAFAHPKQKPAIHDMRAIVQKLHSNNIYAIGRIVTFKDPFLAASDNTLALRTKSGEVWKDAQDKIWLNPYNRKTWNYNIAIAKEAAALGFDEIQFDYVRFPANGPKKDLEIDFDNPQGWSKTEAIATFLKEAGKQLEPDGVFISADVFGMTTSVNDDMGIGQQWDVISQEVDYISPMLYPSHYSQGNYGLQSPNLQPYDVIKRALSDANNKTKNAEIRPWLQDFSAGWLKPFKEYGQAEVDAQIRAAKEQGINQYLLWNSSCNYSIR